MKHMPEFGRKPSMEDLHKLAAFDATVKACLALHEQGDLTFTEALIGALLALADQKNEAFRVAVNAVFKERVVYIVEKSGNTQPKER